MRITEVFAAALLSMGVASGAWAHGDAKHEKPKHDLSKAAETPFGKPVDPDKAKRHIWVDMSDAMRFSPATLEVKRGESIKFVVQNSGRLMHEMVIGTKKDLEEHAALMRKFPEMEHDEPNMVHVAPGKTGEIGWQFTKPGEFHFACLIPGHYEAGMVGKVIVR